MFKKRTSRRYRREKDCQHMLHLNVNSPRIVMFKSMSAFSGAIKVAFLIALLCLMGWGVKKAVDSLFIKNEEYILKDIDLETNGTFSKQRVVNVTRIKKGATIFSVDTEFMEKELKQLPEVISAKVTRKMPDRLRVSIQERVPVAHIHAPYAGFRAGKNEDSLLIGENGYAFPYVGKLRSVSRNCPVIMVEKGPEFAFGLGEKVRYDEILRAKHLVMKHNELVKDEQWRLKTVKVIDFYTLLAEYSDDVIVTFGMYDHDRQIIDLVDIRKHAQAQGKEVQWLDLRPKRNIPGQYKITQL